VQVGSELPDKQIAASYCHATRLCQAVRSQGASSPEASTLHAQPSSPYEHLLLHIHNTGSSLYLPISL
jgi:hypothetical protein